MSINETFRKGSKGFSLLELLLVLTLAPVVFFAIYSNFSVGVRLWQRLQVSVPEEDVAIFYLKTQEDFTNAVRYSPTPFLAEEANLEFITGIEAKETLGGRRAIGQVRYYYDERARGIAREERDLSRLHQGRSGTSTLVLRGVSGLTLAYLVYDSLAKEYLWLDAYSPAKPADLPIAVRMSFSVDGIGDSVEQTFFLPSGGALP